jgi:hypothetical protein
MVLIVEHDRVERWGHNHSVSHISYITMLIDAVFQELKDDNGVLRQGI